MATDVLRPQDCLIERMRTPSYSSSSSTYSDVVFYRRSPPGGGKTGRPGRRPSAAAAARAEPRRRTRTPEPKKAEEGPVMGQVTILKRGQSLPDNLGGDRKTAVPPPPASPAGDLIVFGAGRIGPDPKVVPVYSGTAFCQSPDPSNLPLPSFPTKKPGLLRTVDDSATKDLRRLLRLD